MTRPRKSETLKKLEGDTSKGKEYRTTPITTDTTPKAPKHLTDDAKKIWKTTINEWKKYGTITKLDSEIFAQYCQSTADYWRLQTEIKAEGEILDGKINPKITLQHKYGQQIRAIASQFGMTPASRSKFVLTDNTKSDFDKFLEGDCN